MNLDEYLFELSKWRQVIGLAAPLPYWDQVARPWFDEIAPVKAREYGIEAWERLGAKGLIAEISGCYYRWKNMKGDKTDVLQDSFGYSIMLSVCRDSGDKLGLGIKDFLDYAFFPSASPHLLIDWIIESGWESDKMEQVEENAIRLAYSMWVKEVSKVA